MVSGRQAQFDKQNALEQAMFVFWEKGFIGSSLTDLTKAMKINKPSMYAAFGNKEALFVQAVENYITHYGKPLFEHLFEEGKTLETRLFNYLTATLKMQCSTEHPSGCFISVALSESASNEIPGNALTKILETSSYTKTMLTEFFKNEIQQGHCSNTLSAEDRALIVVTFLHGLATVARNNSNPAQLQNVIHAVIKSLDIDA